MPTCSITDDIVIDNPEAVEKLVEILEEGERATVVKPDDNLDNNEEKPFNFRGNKRNSIYEIVGTKRVQRRRRILTFLEQQQLATEAQLQLFKDGKMKYYGGRSIDKK